MVHKHSFTLQFKISGGPPQQPPPQGYYPPPQQGGYQAVPSAPPSSQGYYPPLPQDGAYPPQSGAYPPQGGAYLPQGQTCPPVGATGEPVKGQEGVVFAEPTTMVIYAQDELDQVSDYMIANILASLMCCWCIGCFAIMKSNQCQNAKRNRNLEAAKRYSASAKKLLIATIVAGIVAVIIMAIYYVVFLTQILSTKHHLEDYN